MLRSNYKSLTVSKLKEILTSRGLTGNSGLNKSDLIQKLNNYDDRVLALANGQVLTSPDPPEKLHLYSQPLLPLNLDPEDVGYIYFLMTDLNVSNNIKIEVKVGYTVNLIGRLKQHRTGNSKHLDYYLAIQIPRSKMSEIEAGLHRFLKRENRHKNLEWFYLTKDEIRYLACDVCKNYDATYYYQDAMERD